METPSHADASAESTITELAELYNAADKSLANGSREEDNIRKLVEATHTFLPNTPGGELHDFFEGHPTAEGVVIVDAAQSPLGLVMRNEYYQKLGSLYGRDLFLKRPVKLVMNAHPLVVDVSVDIATISMIAMNRNQKELYDMVVITEDERFMGVVSIKRFMIELSRNREKEIELLKQQKEILRLANETETKHRKQIEDKNNALRDKNDSIKNLLDNAGQGFLSFGPDLLVSEEYSLECVNIFRGPIGKRHFVELMQRHVKEDTASMLQQVLANVFDASKELQQKVYLSLLPSEFSIYNKSVHIEFKVITHMGEKRLMLVLTDITEKKELEQKMARERSNLRMVVKALAEQSDVNAAIESFKDFVNEEAKAIIEGAATPAIALNELFRMVHTFKGDFAQLGMHNTASRLHDLEDMLGDLCADQKQGKSCSAEQLLNISREWDAEAIMAEDKSIIVEALGRSFFETEERFLISREQLMEVEQRISGLLGEPERQQVLPMLRRMRSHNVNEILKGYDDYLAGLAGRLEKQIEPIIVSGDDCYVDKQRYLRFFKSLVHIFRNMIDHGIESPEERLESGKREYGKILCNIEDKGDGIFKINIADDGRGIDIEKVKKAAVAKGIVNEDEAAAMGREQGFALLFEDSFSTRSEVTALSGRGVGLSAVLAETQALGGRIEVSSKRGQGSTFSFYLPLETA